MFQTPDALLVNPLALKIKHEVAIIQHLLAVSHRLEVKGTPVLVRTLTVVDAV